MDTHGHHECAEQVGEPLINAALERAGKSDWRTNAYYLGNWITDVQQLVDPVANARVTRELEGAITAISNELKSIPSSGWQGYLRSGAISAFDNSAAGLRIGMSWLLRDSSNSDGRNSHLAKTFKSAFFVNGYFEFVHPATNGARAGMDFSAFEHVFDVGYRQYFPHEHLDRWTPDGSEGSGAAFQPVNATVTVAGRGPHAGSRHPHTYQYIRDDVQIAAGLLAELERDWANDTFRRSTRWTDDTNHDWNWKLAQLGHAMHACEDFFAHTNFVELAIESLPAAERNRLRPGNSRPIADFGPTAIEIYRLRLRKFSGNMDAPDAGPETRFVTGYFDFVDTFFSMRHAYDDLFGGSDGLAPLPGVESNAHKIGALARKVVLDIRANTASEALSADQTEQAVDAALARALANSSDPDAQEAARLLLHSTVPQQVRQEFNREIAGLVQTIPNTAISMFDVLLFIKAISDGVAYPSEILRWFLRDVPDSAINWVLDQVNQTVGQRIRTIVDQYLGRYRIGCHSLIAKDYVVANNDLTRIYNQAKNCAKAIHWYVIMTITRMQQPRSLSVARADSASPTDENRNRVSSSTIVDWLELLESFLGHPIHAPTGQSEYWWKAVIQRNDWRRFPGFSGLSNPERIAGLTHRLQTINAAQRDQQVTDSSNLRSSGEQAYQ